MQVVTVELRWQRLLLLTEEKKRRMTRSRQVSLSWTRSSEKVISFKLSIPRVRDSVSWLTCVLRRIVTVCCVWAWDVTKRTCQLSWKRQRFAHRERRECVISEDKHPHHWTKSSGKKQRVRTFQTREIFWMCLRVSQWHSSTRERTKWTMCVASLKSDVRQESCVRFSIRFGSRQESKYEWKRAVRSSRIFLPNWI